MGMVFSAPRTYGYIYNANNLRYIGTCLGTYLGVTSTKLQTQSQVASKLP